MIRRERDEHGFQSRFLVAQYINLMFSSETKSGMETCPLIGPVKNQRKPDLTPHRTYQ